LSAIVAGPKHVVKALLRPFVRPLLRPVIRRFEAVEKRLDEVQDLAVRLDRHLPILENVIESQNAELRSQTRSPGDVSAELAALKQDLARTRLEVQALQRHVSSPGTPAQQTAEPGVEASAVPLRAGHGGDEDGRDLRLDFCFGAESAPGHVRVDLGDVSAGDLVAGLGRLRFREGCALEVRASIGLERFSTAELRERVLPYWRSLLAPGARFVVVCVDAEANLADYQAGRLTFEQLAALSHGERRSMLSEPSIGRLLREAGFESIETVARWCGDDAANRIEVRAARPGGGPQPVEAGARTSARA
jgi:hypothetical protein